ncbi:MAG: hypothetical protein JXB14_01390, partial [Candidatus Altiarchaeota archaeon]|nr:hypothetical protein [Candidatus Altiarchaeota archaeon]
MKRAQRLRRIREAARTSFSQRTRQREAIQKRLTPEARRRVYDNYISLERAKPRARSASPAGVTEAVKTFARGFQANEAGIRKMVDRIRGFYVPERDLTILRFTYDNQTAHDILTNQRIPTFFYRTRDGAQAPA